MAIMRYRPRSLLNELQHEMSHLLGHSLADDANDDLSTAATSGWVPAVDIKQDDKTYTISAEVPGIPADKIDVSMEDGVLTISGEKSDESKTEGENYSRYERSYGAFCRRFSLPDTADGDGITAKNKHGVLEIVIPKAAKATARKIDVKAVD